MAKNKVEEIVDITPEDSVVPVFLVPLTAEEEAERVKLAEMITSYEQDETNKAAVRESAIAKLTKLGLTVDEINAVFNL